MSLRFWAISSTVAYSRWGSLQRRSASASHWVAVAAWSWTRIISGGGPRPSMLRTRSTSSGKAAARASTSPPPKEWPIRTTGGPRRCAIWARSRRNIGHEPPPSGSRPLSPWPRTSTATACRPSWATRGPIDDPPQAVGDVVLGEAHLLLEREAVLDLVGGVQDHELAGVQLHGRVGHHPLDRLLVREQRAVREAVERALDEHLEGELGLA